MGAVVDKTTTSLDALILWVEDAKPGEIEAELFAQHPKESHLLFGKTRCSLKYRAEFAQRG